MWLIWKYGAEHLTTARQGVCYGGERGSSQKGKGVPSDLVFFQ